MTKDPEHLVACHKLAESRRKRKLPVWAETVNVAAHFNNDRPFLENRDGIVATLKRSRWIERHSAPVLENQEHLDVVEGLEQAQDSEEFDQYWEELYNLADLDRVWIKTF